MAATEVNTSPEELRRARRWLWAMIAVGVLAFALGLRAAPPVVFIRAEQEEQASKAAQNPKEEKTPPPEEQESGEAERPTMLPWLYLLKR
ncbi:MAG: hypothetical protein IRZ16_01900 [Myxococcaceae bacterium]|nr:hypothetical protein [Myxococcaceae bacterium]